MKPRHWTAPLVVGLAIGLLTLLNQISTGQAPRVKAVVAWEYKVILDPDRDDLDDHTAVLNEWGQKGWELTAVSELHGIRATRFYFKRPKP